MEIIHRLVLHKDRVYGGAVWFLQNWPLCVFSNRKEERRRLLQYGAPWNLASVKNLS